MRRGVGCVERDSRSVEGKQGHDPGGTIDADDMRPLHQMHGATSRMAPGACEDRQPASGSVLSFWGRQAGVASGGCWCSDGLPFVALQPGQCTGQAFKCCAVGTGVGTFGGSMREHCVGFLAGKGTGL